MEGTGKAHTRTHTSINSELPPSGLLQSPHITTSSSQRGSERGTEREGAFYYILFIVNIISVTSCDVQRRWSLKIYERPRGSRASRRNVASPTHGKERRNDEFSINKSIRKSEIISYVYLSLKCGTKVTLDFGVHTRWAHARPKRSYYRHTTAGIGWSSTRSDAVTK